MLVTWKEVVGERIWDVKKKHKRRRKEVLTKAFKLSESTNAIRARFLVSKR